MGQEFGDGASTGARSGEDPSEVSWGFSILCPGPSLTVRASCVQISTSRKGKPAVEHMPVISSQVAEAGGSL